MSVPKIVMIGAGSYAWTPLLLSDLLYKPSLESAHLVLVDPVPEPLAMCEQFAHLVSKQRKLSAKISTATEFDEAADGADFVLITISTGGLEAMRHDLAVPEKYGIFQTVGDTVGPGGWSRSLRNIPVFQRFATIMAERCPQATVLNYTNPLTVLTGVLSGGRNKVVGLCHGLFENIAVLKTMFELESEDDVRLKIAGINHFFWTLAMTIQGKEGYAQLEERLSGRTLAEVVTQIHRDEMGFHSNKYVCDELYRTHGLLPYLGDRHICEFLPDKLAPDTRNLEKYKLERTSIEERYENRGKARQKLVDMLEAREPLPKPTRETAADIIDAIWAGHPIVDVVNVPNIGQVSNLPSGLVVETMGRVTPLGFEPLTAGALPDPIRALIDPHVQALKLTLEAGVEQGRNKALEALACDPLCSHLSDSQIRQMGSELLAANRQWVPTLN